MSSSSVRAACRPPAGLLASVVLLLASGGCGAGAGTDLNQLVKTNPFSDASPPSASVGEAGGSYKDPFSGAPGYAAMKAGGSHHAGESCIQAGCHGSGASGSEAPSFLLGGTVYLDYKGTMPASGVEVRVVDTAGHSAGAYSGPEGNFYIRSGNANGVTFPAVVGARDGTTARPMITTLTGGMGSCGQTTCHVPGGGPTSNTGNYYPIHVP